MIRHAKAVVVGMGEMHITRDPSAVLTCLGLGSCIALTGYDPVTKMGGMTHIVLPDSEGKAVALPAKYADTAVPSLLNKMEKDGADRRRLKVRIAGGAEMSLALGMKGFFKMGERNADATLKALKTHGIRPLAVEIGGHQGRTVKLFVDSGKLIVSSASGDAKEL